MQRRTFFAGTVGFLTCAAGFLTGAVGLSGSLSAAPAGESAGKGRLLHEWWFEPGVEHGNPMADRRFRVNSPQVVLHESFGSRKEVKSSGAMQILAEQDLRECLGAELYLELWGGHPHTANKRVTVNGRSTHALPSSLTAAGHCTHAYPTLALQRTDLVNGYNSLQFACDEGQSFWGHYIVDNACLRTEIPHGLDIRVRWKANGDGIVALELAGADAGKASDVWYEAFYEGFPENGAERQPAWHGFTKARQPEAVAGNPWDTRLLPRQFARVRARVALTSEAANAIFVTAPSERFEVGDDRVFLSYPSALPVPFWSRANRKRTAEIPLRFPKSRIDQAELHVVVWDGGRGNVAGYFTWNGKALPVCGEGRHDVLYSKIRIEPGELQDVNLVELLTDTEHHGIEVLWPGPCLATRLKG